MAESNINVMLDTVRKNNLITIFAVKNDYGARFITAKIMDDGKPKAVKQTATVVINAVRRDKASKSFSGSVNKDGTVKVPVTQWMLDVVGEVECSVAIVSDGTRLTTTSFYINAQKSIWDGVGEPSEDDSNHDVILEIIASENVRIANEEARISAEAERVNNEKTRVDNENIRIENEGTRQALHEEMKTFFDGVENVLTNKNVAQELGNSEEKVLSQKAATENITPNSFVSGNIGVSNVLLTKTGGETFYEGFICRSTDKISCHSGDVFYYNGIGLSSVIVAAQFFNGNEFISYVQTTQGATAEEMEITIPDGVNYVRFGSFGAIFEVKKYFANGVGNLPYLETLVSNMIEEIGKINNRQSVKKVMPEYLATLTTTENLFIANDIRNKYNVYFAGGYAEAENYHITHPILVKGGVTYKYNRADAYGANHQYFIFDENDTYISGDGGTYENGFFEFTPKNDCLVRLNIYGDVNDVVVARKENYPSEYVKGKRTLNNIHFPVANVDGLTALVNTMFNPLYGKKISFNGDSICQGVGYSGGYAGIIGERNNMTVQNIGISGGTIASGTLLSNGSNRHWICDTIVNMDNDADYAIIEGGVNDASLKVPIGAITDRYSNNYDTSTFCGAFEKMLKTLTERFAGKKIGYIAVHKMCKGFFSMPISPPALDGVTDTTSWTQYYDAAKKACEKWGVPFLDLNISVPPFGLYGANSLVSDELKALTTTYTKDGDGWHPNEEGYKKYYVPKIEVWLKTL